MKGRRGYIGPCFSVRKSASEYALSSDTCGRLKDGTMPRRCIVASIVLPAHRRAVVRVQDEAIRVNAFVAADARDHVRGELGGLALLDRPASDAATPDVEDEIQEEEATAHDRR